MIQDKQLDLQHFFERGFAVTQIDPDVSDNLLKLLRAEQWREPEPYAIGKSSPDIISWSNQAPPTVFEAFWRNLADHAYFSYFSIYNGEFSKFKLSAHRWHQPNGLGFHIDYHEALPVNNILYLSGESWGDNDGGELQLGKWRVDRNGFGDKDTVEVLGTIKPKHGTLVTLCNSSPLFCHSVLPMKAEREKYSFLCRFGYAENYEKAKFSSRM